MIRTGVRHLMAISAAGALSLLWAAPASAEPITGSTTCTNSYTGAQAGPSSFDVQVPATAVVGTPVEVSVTFSFTNSSGYAVRDVNGFTQAIATTGTSQNPVTVTAGSQGGVPKGSSISVTQTGAWTPDQAGTVTFTLGTFSFNTVVLGLTIPITCTFDTPPAAVTSVVS